MVRPLFLALASLTLVGAAFASPDKVASPLLSQPTATAKKQNKVVFVSFSASWCGWCHRMHHVLDSAAVKPIWDRYFVSTVVTVDESKGKESLNTPGGDDLRKELHGENVGIPFFAFVGPNGTVLADSHTKPGQGNLGCPATADEIAMFMDKLAKVAPKMTLAERTTIETAFKNAK